MTQQILLQQDNTRKMSASYWCLLAIGMVDFLVITLAPYLNFYLNEMYLIPSILYLGFVLKQQKTSTAKQVFWLSGSMCAWFLIAQLIHHCMGLQTRPFGAIASVQLVALTFAATAEDKRRGLTLYMSVFLAGVFIVLCLAGLAIMNRVPVFLRNNAYFWKSGLIVMAHPSQLAGLLLIGIAFALVFFTISKKIIVKAALCAMIGFLTVTIAMTKCQAVIWVMSALYGAFCLFAIYRGTFSRFVISVIVAVLIFGSTYAISQSIVRWYVSEQARRSMGAHVSTEQIVCGSAADEAFMTANHEERNSAHFGNMRYLLRSAKAEENNEGEGKADRFSLRDTLDRFLPSFNGRKKVWLEIYDVLKKDPKTILFGTDYTNSYMMEHTGRNYAHAHNSWLEVLIGLGLPGLFIVFLVTAIAFWNVFIILFGNQYELWQKCIALLEICLMAIGAMEFHLFLSGLHPTDFTFFLCLGYMIQWRAADKASRKNSQEKTVEEITPVTE